MSVRSYVKSCGFGRVAYVLAVPWNVGWMFAWSFVWKSDREDIKGSRKKRKKQKNKDILESHQQLGVMCAAVLPASSVTSVVMPPALVPEMKLVHATKSATPAVRVPSPVVASACSKALHKLTLSRLLAGFFWTGDKTVYGSKWRLGLFGKATCRNRLFPPFFNWVVSI